jgi:phage-related protein (TIGR01555 family)
MWNWLKGKKTPEVAPVPKEPRMPLILSTHQSFDGMGEKAEEKISQIQKTGLAPFLSAPKKRKSVKDGKKSKTAMDSNELSTKAFGSRGIVNEQQLFWYAQQGFIGYQVAAIMSQHWLIKKCCLMPAKDAVRNGFDITVNDGEKVDKKVLDRIRRLDVDYRLNYNLIQLVDQGRVFGIRIAMFIVDSPDKDYYLKPFNPDGVLPHSYKGISQIDPYLVTPQLDADAAGAPASIHFYEPTWWNVAGMSVHRSHLIVYRTEEVPDILKPSYLYGGVSIPQKVYERVYAAERTANETPLLALTKRTDVLQTDTSQAVAVGPEFLKRIEDWVQFRDNFGVKVIDVDENLLQFDTSLADLDAVIMTQFQLVASAAEVPQNKLLGTTLKGFNSTGNYEEASYHEMLESIQAHDLTPLIERHWLLLIRSEICPEFGIAPFEATVMWKPLDAMTTKELAELNKIKAETGAVLINAGVIDGMEERDRLIADPESGYNGLQANVVPENPEENDEDYPYDKDEEES